MWSAYHHTNAVNMPYPPNNMSSTPATSIRNAIIPLPLEPIIVQAMPRTSAIKKNVIAVIAFPSDSYLKMTS